ncbi:Ig-like domain-containing protein [Aquincola sp. S2]|uniref:Ig-like domain-containing protein n=1 Tax=Pseudaquabacterium terrae TaxID=2732868 RepID=A0ABX2EED2_9BURK|nr:Ig-like domain-containing protein [Aquabacterium terrae]NRF66973.1 Ig-like domain-containing protein [Aquabacterium terrae]
MNRIASFAAAALAAAALLGASLPLAAAPVPLGTLVTARQDGQASLLGLDTGFQPGAGSNVVTLTDSDLELLSADFTLAIDLFSSGLVQLYDNGGTGWSGSTELTLSFAGLLAPLGSVSVDHSMLAAGSIDATLIDGGHALKLKLTDVQLRDGFGPLNLQLNSVPEPATIALIAAALGAAAGSGLRRRSLGVLAAAALALPVAAQTDPARESAPADGWAAMAGGTSGGAAASAEQIYAVSNRAQLLAAINNGGVKPKIIKVVGSIDMSEGLPYASRADQDQRAMVRLPSNTTLIGSGPGAGLANGRIEIIGVSNVIVRNLHLAAPCDIAPVWDPNDGATGNWNAAYDAITILGADHVWIDRNTITDAPVTDDQLPIENGKTRQCHDGAIDITRGANHVTVSYNLIDRHDKTMLIGHSDSFTADIGRLKVTIANNVFNAVGQRAPRVRFGQVHVFNNYHAGAKGAPVYGHSYSVGIGTGAQVISHANVYAISGAAPGCASVLQTLNANAASAFADAGSLLNGAALGACPVSSAVAWSVPYPFTPRPTSLVKANALAKAGAGKLKTTITGSGNVGATPGTLLPAAGAGGVHVDTALLLAFDGAPKLGTSGFVTVRRASDGAIVDRIDLSSTPSTGDTQTILPRSNLEIDALAAGAMLDGRARFVWVRPVTTSGNTATIKLHNNRLAFDTTYTVTIDAAAFGGTVHNAPFAGAQWSFTTRSAPASRSSVTVDDDGSTADFRTLQGALNWVMASCSTGSAPAWGCHTVATPKTITLKNGVYPELATLRNVHNLSIVGESRDGVRVGAVNFESLNSGSGATATSAGTTLTTSGRVPGHRVLGGGRAVLLVENADLLTLQNFTLENPHTRSGLYDNQAEAIYFNTSQTPAAARLLAKEMNFLSEQDTLQLKGYVWVWRSLVAGNVDFIWGGPMAALFEQSEIRSVFDPSSSSPGFILQARATPGDAGFVFLDSTLSAGAGVTQAYLARSGSTTSSTYVDNIAFINTRIGPHILPVGWCVGTGTSRTGTAQGACGSNPPPWAGTANGGATDAAGWREWGSMDLGGLPLDVSGRLGAATVSVNGQPATVQLAKPLDSTSGLATRAEVFFKSTIATGAPGGWVPAP